MSTDDTVRGLIEHVGNIGDEGVYRHQTANGPAETNRLPDDVVELVPAPSVEWCEEMAELGRERDAARAEVERLHSEMERLRRECFELHVEDAAAIAEQAEELAELRARDEAAKAVVQAWHERIAPARTQRMEHLVRLFIGEVLADKLDALVRAHDAGGRHR